MRGRRLRVRGPATEHEIAARDPGQELRHIVTEGERLAEVVGVALAGQDDAAEQLDAGAVGLDPEGEVQVVVDGSPGGGVLVVNVAALAGVDADVLAVDAPRLAGVRPR